jgi:hypothetical protein
MRALNRLVKASGRDSKPKPPVSRPAAAAALGRCSCAARGACCLSAAPALRSGRQQPGDACPQPRLPLGQRRRPRPGEPGLPGATPAAARPAAAAPAAAQPAQPAQPSLSLPLSTSRSPLAKPTCPCALPLQEPEPAAAGASKEVLAFAEELLSITRTQVQEFGSSGFPPTIHFMPGQGGPACCSLFCAAAPPAAAAAAAAASHTPGAACIALGSPGHPSTRTCRVSPTPSQPCPDCPCPACPAQPSWRRPLRRRSSTCAVSMPLPRRRRTASL